MTPSSSNKNKIYKRILLYLAFVVLVLDQIVKHRIRMNFDVGESHPVIPNVFHITYVRNTGAAFSLFRNLPVMTIVLPCVLMAVCVYAIWRLYREDMIFPLVCTELILGGGLGNMVDRIARGYVVDMLDFRVFPVFNVADIAITTGCGLLMIWAFLSERKENAAGQADKQEKEGAIESDRL